MLTAAQLQPTTDPATRLVEAVTTRDFAALERLLAPNVWFRVLLPRRIEEGHSADLAIGAIRRWFGGAAAFRVLGSQRHTMAGREFVGWRILLKPDWEPETWHEIEQSGYCRVKDGQISRLDLICTGFYPTNPEPPTG